MSTYGASRMFEVYSGRVITSVVRGDLFSNLVRFHQLVFGPILFYFNIYFNHVVLVVTTRGINKLCTPRGWCVCMCTYVMDGASHDINDGTKLVWLKCWRIFEEINLGEEN